MQIIEDRFGEHCLQEAKNINTLDVVSNRLLPRVTNKKVHGRGGGGGGGGGGVHHYHVSL